MKKKYKILAVFLGMQVLVSLLLGRLVDGDWSSVIETFGTWIASTITLLIWVFWLKEGDL